MVPAPQWHLGASGRAAARELAGVMPADPTYVTSPNPKAQQTGAELHVVAAGDLCSDDRLVEVQRANTWLEDYRDIARSYVLGALPPGWEPHERVAARVSSAVAQAQERARARPVVLVGHGLSLTVWLTSLGKLDDAGAFWSGLAFPDAWRADEVQPRRLT